MNTSLLKKATALALSILMLVGIAIPVFAAADSTFYTITNPYETVDWDTWNQYKAQMHAHTLYSDGEMDIKDVVEAYYALDYDILAITDHGVVNQGWDKVPEMLPLIGINQYTKKLTPLSSKRYNEITKGTDRNGKGMMDVSLGIEMNGVVMRKNHVNGYFCGYGQGLWGNEEDYETPIAQTDKAGGISVINHPGDFFGANQDINRAFDPDNILPFANIFLKYESCVGTEAFNLRDTSARYDRVLWDNMLMYTIPRGRNIWGFASDDSHVESHIGCTADVFLMPEHTEKALRDAMEDGTFFACSKYARLEMGEEFVGTGNFAEITNIVVDDNNDTISITFKNTDLYSDKNAACVIECVADGVVIDSYTWESAQDSYTYTFDLNKHCDDIGSYVRFQIKDNGGMVLTQPFICDDGNMKDYLVNYPEKNTDYGTIGNFIFSLYETLRKTIIGELLYKLIVLQN